MSRLVIKLAIAAVLAHGVVRIVPVFWTNVRFQDALQETARFAGTQSEEQLLEKAVKLAEGLEVPVDADEIKVKRSDRSTVIDARYVAQLEYFPTKFYPWEFIIHVDQAPSRLDAITR